nr:DUF721 domain-containing protein [candidate division Zixibacteria bacterium]
MKTFNTGGNKKDAVLLGTFLDGLMVRLGLAHNLGGWRIVSRWAGIVGDKMASVSRAVRFSDDTLLVSVPDAVWRHQMSMEVDAILEKIHAVPGGRAVKRILFIS